MTPDTESQQTPGTAPPTVVAAALDATGLVCPEPLMVVRNRVRGLARGEILHVVATDPTTRRDFTDFCRFMGHVMVFERADAGRFEYWIRKGPA